MDIKQYINDPCGTLSIPYWKSKITKLPSHIQIFHEKYFLDKKDNFLKVDKFFRLIHRLKEIPKEDNIIQDINLDKELGELINMINICYEKENIKVSKRDIQSWLSREVYCQELWVIIKNHGKIIASGIAEYDEETKEGILEWIQVLPKYQGFGYGKLIVDALVNRLSKVANFITVSGRLDNTSNPKKLYTNCGFEGNDIWYVCTIK